MNKGNKIAKWLFLTAGALPLAACTSAPPPHHPGPYTSPADAFNSVSAPYDPSIQTNSPQPLTHDIAHLRKARNAYKHSQAVQAARLQDEQQACKNNPDAHLVRIQDGTGDSEAVYCQAPATGSSQSQN